MFHECHNTTFCWWLSRWIIDVARCWSTFRGEGGTNHAMSLGIIRTSNWVAKNEKNFHKNPFQHCSEQLISVVAYRRYSNWFSDPLVVSSWISKCKESMVSGLDKTMSPHWPLVASCSCSATSLFQWLDILAPSRLPPLSLVTRLHYKNNKKFFMSVTSMGKNILNHLNEFILQLSHDLHFEKNNMQPQPIKLFPLRLPCLQKWHCLLELFQSHVFVTLLEGTKNIGMGS